MKAIPNEGYFLAGLSLVLVPTLPLRGAFSFPQKTTLLFTRERRSSVNKKNQLILAESTQIVDDNEQNSCFYCTLEQQDLSRSIDLIENMTCLRPALPKTVIQMPQKDTYGYIWVHTYGYIWIHMDT